MRGACEFCFYQGKEHQVQLNQPPRRKESMLMSSVCSRRRISDSAAEEESVTEVEVNTPATQQRNYNT